MSDSIQEQLQTKIQQELGISSNGKFEAIIGDVMSTYIAAQIAPLQAEINALKSGSPVTGSLGGGAVHIVPPVIKISSGSGGTNASGGGGSVTNSGGGGGDSGGNSNGSGADNSLKQV